MISDPRVPSSMRHRVWSVIFIVVMSSLIVVGTAIQRNTDRLEHVVYTQCQGNAAAAIGINAVLDSLIHNVTVTESLPDTEKVARLKTYTKTKVSVPHCTKP